MGRLHLAPQATAQTQCLMQLRQQVAVRAQMEEEMALAVAQVVVAHRLVARAEPEPATRDIAVETGTRQTAAITAAAAAAAPEGLEITALPLTGEMAEVGFPRQLLAQALPGLEAAVVEQPAPQLGRARPAEETVALSTPALEATQQRIPDQAAAAAGKAARLPVETAGLGSSF